MDWRVFLPISIDTRGNGVWYAAAYNSRLQPVESYESVGNSASGFIALSCLNWGTQRPADFQERHRYTQERQIS
jgi:hypothetical protein